MSRSPGLRTAHSDLGLAANDAAVESQLPVLEHAFERTGYAAHQ